MNRPGVFDGDAAAVDGPARRVDEQRSTARPPQPQRFPGTATGWPWPLLVTLGVQCALVGVTFPWQQLWSALPLLGIDHPYHLYQVHVAQALAARGQLSGYDPFFAAGYLGGVTFNASAKGPALLAWLLGGAATELQSYKLYVFAVSVLGPAAPVWAARAVRATAPQGWCCAGLSIAMWWASPLHWYQTAGLVSFVFVSCVAVPFCLSLNRLFDEPRVGAGQLLLLGGAAALAFAVHPLFAVPVLVFCLVRLALVRPAIAARRWLARLACVCGVGVLPNLPWLAAMAGSSNIGSSQYAVSYQTLVDSRLLWMELLGLNGGPAKGAKVFPLLAVLSAWALAAAGPPWRTPALASVGCWLLLVLFAAFGAALPVFASLQPNRFSASAYLFLIVPAAVGAAALGRVLREVSGTRRVVTFACAGIAGLLALAAADEVRREASSAHSGRYGSAPPDVRGVGVKGQALLRWLASDTRPDARVLFETSMARVHDGGHIVGYLQLQSGREFIGGPYNNFFAGTRDGWMFGRPLADIDPATFAAYLRLYNVGWIVVHSDTARRYLARLGERLVSGPVLDGLQTYSVDQPAGFVERGRAAVVTRDYGRLVVEQRGAPGEDIVLRYHFVPGLHAADGSSVQPVYLMDDPQPFIRVTPRAKTVELVR